MKEASFYKQLDSHMIQCTLCPHHCSISEGKYGICNIRLNQNGTLYAESYGKITSIALDPIEKKPLYHFYPGSKILSIGSYGCNFRCGFCQNYKISMEDSSQYYEMSPEQLAYKAKELTSKGNIGLAYTYNEPFISAEFLRDCAIQIHKQGLKNIVVTNGYVEESTLTQLLPYIDAMNIDLKSFREPFYKKLGGQIEPVKRTIELAANHCHVEVTTLVIPDENDSEEEMEMLSSWIAQINQSIPLHISRFFPTYQYQNYSATPVDTVYRLVEKAKQQLKFVYSGNC